MPTIKKHKVIRHLNKYGVDKNKTKEFDKNKLIDMYKMLVRIIRLFNEYESQFTRVPNNRLTEYEKAAGYTELSRNGSKQFTMALGKFFEDILNLSPNFTKIPKEHSDLFGSNDGMNEKCYFESKSRHDTMNQQMAPKMIEPKLKKAISDNKKFYLLIFNDQKSKSRCIPLHEGNGLSKIQNIDGYDPKKHKWISGDNIYKLFFPDFPFCVKNIILNILSTLSIS